MELFTRGPFGSGSKLAEPPVDSIAFGSEASISRNAEPRNLLTRSDSEVDGQPPLHVKARSHPGRAYPPRFPVSDEQVSWEAEYPEYNPPRHTEPSVLKNAGPGGWAEQPEPNKADIERRGSHELQARQQAWRYDDSGRPLNPRGRTGIADRGALGKWGPNHAGDAVVTRHVCKAGGGAVERLEVVVIRRSDTGEWALPGGMQDPGEVGFQTLVREFREEAAAAKDEAEQEEFDAQLRKVFHEDNGTVLYRGYVDDPRNTDHAWMETTAMHFHCPRDVGDRLRLAAGDDATAVAWMEVGGHNPAYRALYGSHKQIIDLTLLTHSPEVANAQAADGSGTFLPTYGGASFFTSGRSGRTHSLMRSVCAALCGSSGGPSSGDGRGRGGLTADDVRGSCGTHLLDLDSICPDQLKMATVCVRVLVGLRRGDGDEADDDIAAATQAVASAVAAELHGDGRSDFNASTSENVYANLRTLKPFSAWLPVLETKVMPLLEAHRPDWRFATDGSSGAPELPSAHAEFVLDGTVQAALRTLAFIDKPPALTCPADIDSLRIGVFNGTRTAEQPTAIVMAGPPGAGKSYSMSQLLPWLERTHGAPSRDSFAYINPDLWISKHCDNNNDYRLLANYCNHETFLQCVAQRRHLVFDATGRQLENTCGRVIGRLARANYRVHLVVVLASYGSCWKRVEARRAETGRAVPQKFFAAIFADLRKVVPVYLRGAANGLCETSVLCNNDRDATRKNASRLQPGVATRTALTVESPEEEVEEAVQRAAALLRPPAS